MGKTIAVLSFAAALLLCGCSDQTHAVKTGNVDDEQTLRINGASTVGHVIPDLIEGFRKEQGNENVRIIYPEGPGSEGLASALDGKTPRGSHVWGAWQGSTWGLKLLCRGDVDIGAMARRPLAAELEKARGEGVNPKLHVIAYDAVALLVHPNIADKLTHVTRDQIRRLYLTGETVSWNELSAALPDKPIQPLGSNPAICGTALAFAEIIDPKLAKSRSLAEVFSSKVRFCELANVIGAVMADEYALGFVQFALLPANSAAMVVPYLDEEDPSMKRAVAPSVETCSNGMYPLQRPLLLITNGTAKGPANRFLRFILGAKGQQILENRRCIVPR
jgi:phosphate transport system substrate-binding protein